MRSTLKLTEMRKMSRIMELLLLSLLVIDYYNVQHIYQYNVLIDDVDTIGKNMMIFTLEVKICKIK